ncbi:MAG: outer membrane beta-barrel protein [Acidobacteria bacterium]|nr:outer membrane beta-barrel protein [Acidobacteriota bacterium]
MSTVRGTIAVALAVAFMLVGGAAYAQSTETPRVEIGIFPGGTTYFTQGDSGAPSFATYTLVGSVTFNVNRYVGVEGEVGGNIGIDQALDFPTGSRDAKPPHMASYGGNVVVYPGGRDRRGVPYVTGGAGGLTLFDRADLGVTDNTTLFAGNVGGGVKFDVNRRWGVRADYRFVAVASKNDAPGFFGIENRYGHRITGGVVLNFPQ